MTRSWDYGDAGDRWDVRPGDVWTVGPHVLSCADLQGDKDVLDRALGLMAVTSGQSAPEVVYVDPPWDAGNARSFRTKANKQTPSIETGPVDFLGLLRAVLDVAGGARRDVFIEMGLGMLPTLLDLIREEGGTALGTAPITYYGSKPCALIHATFSGQHSGFDVLSAKDMDDEKTPAACIEATTSPGDVVFDPCMGRGLIAVSADRLGRVAWGNELNPRRLAVTIDKLVKQGGYEPTTIWRDA